MTANEGKWQISNSKTKDSLF